ncbi:major epididymal secretory protein HE1, putative [Ixodes scapularis]|uniref:Major epididymal secretory protein HE1, putative n=1 Tax=Ixodes scapularis TaxID=6945 RepID=B7PQ51_IXOSC|nr:major epididymal secretory protein HE1, putative [Ixodes scapularis]|eukprot:XP_002435893.1 major epididymal secretory protein HE1, putative [Ixodes scapularis]
MASSVVLALAVVVCAGFVVGDLVAFKDCGHGNVKSVNIVSCKKAPCKVKIGTRVVFEASFVAPFDVTSAFNDIGAYIERHRFRLPEPRVDACNGYLSPRCPMRKGQTYTYRYTMPVREIYPATPATIEYKLTNEEGRLIGCTSIPVQIFR